MTHDLKLRLVWLSPNADSLIRWSGVYREAARRSFARFVVEPANEDVFLEAGRMFRDIPARVSWGKVYDLSSAVLEHNTYVYASIADFAQHEGDMAAQLDQHLRPHLPWSWPALKETE